jgi:hypothetical protein
VSFMEASEDGGVPKALVVTSGPGISHGMNRRAIQSRPTQEFLVSLPYPEQSIAPSPQKEA